MDIPPMKPVHWDNDQEWRFPQTSPHPTVADLARAIIATPQIVRGFELKANHGEYAQLNVTLAVEGQWLHQMIQEVCRQNADLGNGVAYVGELPPRRETR